MGVRSFHRPYAAEPKAWSSAAYDLDPINSLEEFVQSFLCCARSTWRQLKGN